jgi:hypothetical protein
MSGSASSISNASQTTASKRLSDSSSIPKPLALSTIINRAKFTSNSNGLSSASVYLVADIMAERSASCH